MGQSFFFVAIAVAMLSQTLIPIIHLPSGNAHDGLYVGEMMDVNNM